MFLCSPFVTRQDLIASSHQTLILSDSTDVKEIASKLRYLLAELHVGGFGNASDNISSQLQIFVTK